jgi:hypothetical protein
MSGLVVQGAGKQAHCAMCTDKFAADSKTRFRVTRKGGKVLLACCAHCGLQLVGHLKDVVSCTTYDYSSGKEVDATVAYYVEHSRERPCCMASVLAFATQEDAVAFQKQYGGSVVDYQEALKEANANK